MGWRDRRHEALSGDSVLIHVTTSEPVNSRSPSQTTRRTLESSLRHQHEVTRDLRPRQPPTVTSHAVPTGECQSDPPSLLQALRCSRPRGSPSTRAGTLDLLLHVRTPNRMSYAGVGGPNQVVSASASPSSVRSPTQATYPSGRINTAVGAVTAPIAGSSHVPTDLASID